MVLLKTFTILLVTQIVAGKTFYLASFGDDELLVNRIPGDTGLKKISPQNLLNAVPTTS